MMAIFNQYSKEQIEGAFTHYAWFCGLYPVYFNVYDNNLDVRNGWPEWGFDVVRALFDMYCEIATTLDPTYDPLFPIKLTGEIKSAGPSQRNKT